jgi:hypothetical protein
MGIVYKAEDLKLKRLVEDIPKLEPNIPYTIHIENTSAVYRWIVENGVTLIKPGVTSHRPSQA